MATPPALSTFRDPAFSLWQSAIHSRLKSHPVHGKDILASSQSGVGATANHDYMLAAIGAMEELQALHSATPPPNKRGPATVGVVGECAKLAAELAWAQLFDPARVPILKSQLRFGQCDPFWTECIAVYEDFLASRQRQPYRVYSDINEYVLQCLPDTGTVAIIADWGTGMNDAVALLEQIALHFQPQLLIHLGDVYYSGLPAEDADHFVSIINRVWPQNPPLVFTLDGNHDRYAGDAGGYYSLIANLNRGANLPQPNSYFALRNNFWQFLAMDTGYHDSNPFTAGANLTYLEQTEIDWHLDKIHNNGKGVDLSVNPVGTRGTVMLSHHQLFSATGVGANSAGQQLAINPNLANAFAPAFGSIACWLWGHEHDLCIFEPYSFGPGQPLPAGRCIGASAVPIYTSQKLAPKSLVIPPSETGPPRLVPNTALGSHDDIFNHAYAIMTLNRADLTIDYYQIDSAAAPGAVPAPISVPHRDQLTIPAITKAMGQTGIL